MEYSATCPTDRLVVNLTSSPIDGRTSVAKRRDQFGISHHRHTEDIPEFASSRTSQIVSGCTEKYLQGCGWSRFQSRFRLFALLGLLGVSFFPGLVGAGAAGHRRHVCRSRAQRQQWDGPLVLVMQSPNYNTYIHFNMGVFPPTLTSSEIDKATLRFLVDSISNSGQFSLFRLYLSPTWTESTLTGLNAPSCDTSTSPVAMEHLERADQDYIAVDVTAIVQYWYTNPGTNNGIGIMASNPVGNAAGEANITCDFEGRHRHQS